MIDLADPLSQAALRARLQQIANEMVSFFIVLFVGGFRMALVHHLAATATTAAFDLGMFAGRFS